MLPISCLKILANSYVSFLLLFISFALRRKTVMRKVVSPRFQSNNFTEKVKKKKVPPTICFRLERDDGIVASITNRVARRVTAAE